MSEGEAALVPPSGSSQTCLESQAQPSASPARARSGDWGGRRPGSLIGFALSGRAVPAGRVPSEPSEKPKAHGADPQRSASSRWSGQAGCARERRHVRVGLCSHVSSLQAQKRIKRGDDSKETYKLPHRLIEKKRRDRINECIAQLKDLLPEHLKLTTLGHLEKAVVLELTLKHVKALTSLIEQQQQQIIALQKGLHADELPSRSLESSQEIFRSGFQMCAKEVLQYLAKHENTKELKSSQFMTHLHRMAEALQSGISRKPGDAIPKLTDLKEKSVSLTKAAEAHGKNCVPVIQRTFAHSSGEQSGSDTDTDSGYGGELEKSDSKSDPQYFKKDTELKYAAQERISSIKQENEDPPAKRTRMDMSEDEDHFSNNILGSSSNSCLGPHPHQPPLCLPFYVFPPSATAYLPMLEKCWYPASVPILYPSLPTSTAALSGLMNPEKMSSPLLLPHRLPSPIPSHSPMDSTALLQALKQMSPLDLETKD